MGIDKGMVISFIAEGVESYQRDEGNNWSGYFKFNAIDPSMTIISEGEFWLIYGSWDSAIAAVELDSIIVSNVLGGSFPPSINTSVLRD